MRFFLVSLLSLNLMAADDVATSGPHTPLKVAGQGPHHTSPASGGGSSTVSVTEGSDGAASPASGGSGAHAAGAAMEAMHLDGSEDRSINAVISRMQARLRTLPEFAHPDGIEPAAKVKSVEEQSIAIHLFHHVTDILEAMEDILKLENPYIDTTYGLVGYIDCRLVALTTRKLMPDFEDQYDRDYGSTFDRDRYDMLSAVKDIPWNNMEKDYANINDIIECDYPDGRP